VWLITAGVADHPGAHGRVRSGPESSRRLRRPRGCRRAHRRWRAVSFHRSVAVRRQLGEIHGVCSLAGHLPEGDAVPDMDRHPALQVGEPERHPAVATVGGPEDREQRLVLVDRQQLAVAEGPTLRWEVPADDLDLSDEMAQPWERSSANCGLVTFGSGRSRRGR